MGMEPSSALASLVAVKRCLEVSYKWMMEDAATVTIIYVTPLSALCVLSSDILQINEPYS